jgi:hypothetical protein
VQAEAPADRAEAPADDEGDLREAPQTDHPGDRALEQGHEDELEVTQKLDLSPDGPEHAEAEQLVQDDAPAEQGAEPAPTGEPVACADCDATGSCRRCGGRGRRFGRRCAECSGSGTCSTCGGPGYIWVDEPVAQPAG